MSEAINSMVDEYISVGLTAGSAHPMDSSRVLMALLSLARDGQSPEYEIDDLEGIVSSRVLRRILSALQFRDEATLSHARRVSCMATGMASRLGWEGRMLRVLEVAALLHDVGKIGVPDHILLKPAKLSPDESDFMAAQHDVGIQLLQACRIDPAVIQIISEMYSHAEGDQSASRISSQGAKILAVADAFDSLSNDQAYRRGLSKVEVLNILTSKTGRRFDRNIVLALGRWLDTDGGFLFDPELELRTTAVNAVVDWETVRQASTMGHIVSYLYLIESLYDGFYIVDSDLRFAVWNRGAENLFGLGAGEALKETWSRRVGKFVDEGGREIPEKEYPLYKVMETGRPYSATFNLVHEDNTRESIEILSLPLLDHDGSLQGAAEIFRNLAGVKRNPGRYRELQWAATRDPLTGVANRGSLQTRLTELHTAWVEKSGTIPLSVVFLDIDHFKSINDNYDHSTGDRVLIDLVQMLQDELYSGELLGRYGGEEFVILCPETNLEQAVERAERLRRGVMGMRVTNQPQLQVTASFGVAEMKAGDSVESLLQRADQALYEAKRTGRNKTCHAAGSGAGPVAAESIVAAAADPFLYESSFISCDASDVIVQKLSGFVNDNVGRVLAVEEKKVRIRIGRPRLLFGWGKQSSKQPVELELELSSMVKGTGKRDVSRRREINVCVRPVGEPKDEAQFRQRAGQVVELLRSYCLAE
jgi:diguanylate cyclase (GGDEF)-like protein/putative nucleotidyltransferase with HDIG domain